MTPHRRAYMRKYLREYSPKWRAENRARINAARRKWRAARIALHRAIIYTGLRCTDCGALGGNTYHTRMEFDHIRGRKTFDIGARLSSSLSALRREIKKCEPVCHLCHVRRTTKRGQWNKGRAA